MTKPQTPPTDAQRYIQWRNEHWFWRDHKQELDKMLDEQIAQTQKRQLLEELKGNSSVTRAGNHPSATDER